MASDQQIKLVLFTGGVRSACGYGAAQMGPFDAPTREGLYRPQLLPGAERGRRCRQAHVRRMRLATMCRSSRHCRSGRGRASAHGPGPSQCAPGAYGAAGRLLAGIWANHTQESKNIIEPGDMRTRSMRRAPSATTAFRNRPRAMWCRTPSPMAPRRSVCAGSSAAMRAASSTPAIPSTPTSSRRNRETPKRVRSRGNLLRPIKITRQTA